jgi:phytoene/squalene synthetase
MDEAIMRSNGLADSDMAAAITYAASLQTGLTIRYLVDKGMVENAYRAYGYFRWVDDWIDQEPHPRQDRLAFVTRQKELMEACYRGKSTGALVPEERMLVNLIASEPDPNSGLHIYIRDMMSVMHFDAERRGRQITQNELDQYTRWLASAVTEALHYFIGHDCASPQCEARYLAVSGAHITHMLRDAMEDAEAGYYNTPQEVLPAHQLMPLDVRLPAYRAWVKERVQKARQCFQMGSIYLAQVECLRCRIAGYAYMRRFEWVLNSIERDGYLLRKQYLERKELGRQIEMIGSALWMALQYHRLSSYTRVVINR